MERIKEIVKIEVSGRNKTELELIKFKIFEYVNQLEDELLQGDSMIEKYINYLEEHKSK